MPRLILSLLMSGLCHANHNQPLDRPYTLRNLEPFILEQEYRRIIAGNGPMSFIYPRPCVSPLDSSSVCGDSLKLTLQDREKGYLLNGGPVGGVEYRYSRESISAFDAGILLSGYYNAVSYYLDARMFTELHELAAHPSFDGETVDRQSESQSGSIAYTSYSRFRSNVNYDFSWGRFTVARDAVHWGPGIFSNLMFHQNAVPFNHLTFTTHLGPLSVISLYGQLAIDGLDGQIRISEDTRSVYAHRYELRAGQNFLFGVSEQLMLFNFEDPFAFIPVVPLYIAKGTQREAGNNGNLAFDLAYRYPDVGLFYSEFLIDDIISPTAIFNDYWGNRWGWMAGCNLMQEARSWQIGEVLEYSRIEPWVYTHTNLLPGDDSSFAQSANYGFPLGNQDGPNSQSVKGKLYLKSPEALYMGVITEIFWKGTGAGSGIMDQISDSQQSESKVFIKGVDKPDIIFSPCGAYTWKNLVIEGKISLGTTTSGRIRAQIFY